LATGLLAIDLSATGVAAAAGPTIQAGPVVQVEPASAAPSRPVVASGRGFQPRGVVGIYLGRVVPGQEVATAAVTGGGFTATFAAPGNPGRYTVVACRDLDAAGGCREQATAGLVVVPPTVTTRPATTRPPDVPTSTSTTSTTSDRPGGSVATTAPPTGGTEPPPGSSTTGGERPPSTAPGAPTTAGGTTSAVPPGAGLELDRPAAVPGEAATVRGWGCDPDHAVSVTVAGRSVATATTDGSGAFAAPLDVPGLDAGRYRVVARCPQRLSTDLDVVLATAVRPMTATLAVLVFFVLLVLGAARRFLGVGASTRGAA
jgi:hypothetical protein